jgi:hypothetical protein
MAAAWVKAAAGEQPTIDIITLRQFVHPNEQNFLYPWLENLSYDKIEWKVSTETPTTDVSFFFQKRNGRLKFLGS